MSYEIERKFLVQKDFWTPPADGKSLQQGYLSQHPARSVRVRIANQKATLTIKGKSEGIRRLEFEYVIPIEDAQQLLDLCEGSIIQKIRYNVEHEGFTWDVDVFGGDNEGLILAEVELENEDQAPALPAWIGQEVSDDVRYYNANLVSNPYIRWKDDV